MTDIEAAVLEVLGTGEDFGLAIHGRLVAARAAPASWSVMHVYPLLRGMEAAGWLVSRDGEPLAERGGRPRVHYAVTEEGQRALAAHRAPAHGVVALT